MTIEATLYTRLSGYSALTALVGDRIYPQRLPQEVTFPAMTYQLISHPEQEHCMVGDVGITNPRFQFTAWGDTHIEVVNIIAQVKAALQRWTTTGIQDTFIALEPYDLDYDEEAMKFGRAIDVRPFVEE